MRGLGGKLSPPLGNGAARIRRRAPQLLRVLGAALLSAALLDAQVPAPGTTRWSPDGYIEYQGGNAPIVISSGHGGDLTPATIPDRTYGTLTKDTRTIELARELAERLAQRFGLRPHLVICHLARTKLDVNRDIVEGAQGNALAIAAYNAFHQACTDARNAVQTQWGAGMYLDMHGHGHAEGWVELGYSLSSAQLALPDSTLSQAAYLAQSTIRSVGGLPGVFFPEVLRGPSSLGGYLQAGGYNSVPSPANPGPGTGNYFSGGFNVETYGSKNGGSVDGIQLETPITVRSTVLVRGPFADRIGGWLQSFFPQYRGLDPAAGSRITVSAADRVASETGGRAEFVLRRSGNVSGARILALQWTGSAIAGVDYASPPTLAAFAPGQVELRIPIVPIEDGLAEGDETVEVALAAGADIGVPSVARIVIYDDEANAELALRLPCDSAAGGVTAETSGNARTASLLPALSPPAVVAGRRGNALRFDGVDDRVRLLDFAYAPAGEFALTFWFRTANTAGTGFRYLVSHGAVAATNRLGVYLDQATGTLRTGLVYANDLTGIDVLDVTRDLRDGQWHHYALVAQTRGLVQVWIDGQAETSAVFLGNTIDPAGDFVLGARSDLSAGTFADVAMDEVQIYNRALSAVEVQWLFAGPGPEAMVYPGTGEDVQLGTGVNGAATTGERQDVKSAPAGSAISCAISTGGALLGSAAVLLCDLCTTGAVPVHPLFASVHLGPQPVVLGGPYLLSTLPQGTQLSVPPGFGGLSLMVQPVALSTAASNGLFAAGDAHEIRLR